MIPAHFKSRLRKGEDQNMSIATNMPIGRQFLVSQQSGDLKTALEIGERILERNPDDESRIRSLARICGQLREHEKANKLWLSLGEKGNHDLEVAYQIASYFYQTNNDAEKSLALVPFDMDQRVSAHVIRILENSNLVDHSKTDKRIVAICGVSFCGSTLLDRVLGSLPACGSIGESHWLGKTYIDKISKTIDFSTDAVKGIPQCTVCGVKCTKLTHDFRAELVADRSDWYFKIAERLDCNVLFTADKNIPKLIENDPLLRMDGVVVFKSPAQAWYSHLTKLPQGLDDDFYKNAFEKYLKTWTNAYAAYLDTFKPKGNLVFMNFDRFSNNPEQVFTCLLSELNLPMDLSVLDTARPGHAIGGNGKAMSRIRDKDYKISIYPLKEVDIPEYQLRAIADSKELQSVYQRMLDRCVSNNISTH